MQDQTLIHDPNLQRLVQDFDALADLLQTLIDRDRRPRAAREHPGERDGIHDRMADGVPGGGSLFVLRLFGGRFAIRRAGRVR